MIDVDEVTARAAAHERRLLPYVQPHLERRKAGIKHPVHDFMFDYYSLRPSHLLRWTPGDDDLPEHKRALVRGLRNLLTATRDRRAQLGCFGLHEWAMVYRADQTRHARRLRLGAEETDQVVESHRITCTHFDAYRFFTPDAMDLNTLDPRADDRPQFEQPGCLHAGMDLYKHAFRLAPHIGSDLIADAFELAWDIRIMDMRAAPYDLDGLALDPTGAMWTPIRIETVEGKREYADQQVQFAERGAPIRQRLIDQCEHLLHVG
ncbi:hypothetical protein BH09ACT11_BH09ACT11_01350 [soil metagenome]